MSRSKNVPLRACVATWPRSTVVWLPFGIFISSFPNRRCRLPHTERSSLNHSHATKTQWYNTDQIDETPTLIWCLSDLFPFHAVWNGSSCEDQMYTRFPPSFSCRLIPDAAECKDLFPSRRTADDNHNTPFSEFTTWRPESILDGRNRRNFKTIIGS